MILSTTVVLVISGLTILFGALSRTEALRPLFSTLGLGSLVDEPISRRMIAGALGGILGGILSAVWVWVIQRQEIIGSTSLCIPGSGCVAALSQGSSNNLPFTGLEFGLFFILLFSILGWIALTLHLDPKASNALRLLSWGRILSGAGTAVAVWMTIIHLAFVDDSPAICPVCLVLLVANIVTFAQFHLLYTSHSNGSWNDK
ncbi:MAG: hypothetical protein HOE69_07745 [Euryarchaeota archaeon]|jgi:hypothetical protein|nr:hypothetical protein [Euryarchaeota archaeon]